MEQEKGGKRPKRGRKKTRQRGPSTKKESIIRVCGRDFHLARVLYKIERGTGMGCRGGGEVLRKTTKTIEHGFAGEQTTTPGTQKGASRNTSMEGKKIKGGTKAI